MPSRMHHTKYRHCSVGVEMACWKEVGSLNLLLLEHEDWSRSQDVFEDSKQKQAKLNRRNTCSARIWAAQGLVCEVHPASMLKAAACWYWC
jgi:hypothetical protein